MTLADLRRLSVRKQVHIRFRLKNGIECVIDEHGIARVPELRGVPDFNLEQELAAAGEFRIDPVPKKEDKHAGSGSRTVSREELARWTSAGPLTAAAGEHQED